MHDALDSPDSYSSPSLGSQLIDPQVQNDDDMGGVTDSHVDRHGSNQVSDPRRVLSFSDGVAIVLGIQIGSGIFASPALVVRYAQSEVAALLLWCVGGGLAWACAACFIELGVILPVNGGPQEFIAHCFGDSCGFVASWSGIFAVKPCSTAILAVFVSDYLCSALLGSQTGSSLSSLGLRKGVALAVIGGVAAVNCAGNKSTNLATKALLACKIIGVGLVIIAGLLSLFIPLNNSNSSQSLVEVGHSTESGESHYTDALLSVMWAYSGWEALAYIGGELNNPNRNVALVINVSMATVIVLSIFSNMAYFSALSYDEIVQSTTIALTFANRLLGAAGGTAYTVLICLSTLGTLNAKTFTAARLTQAAAGRRFLPAFLSTIGSNAGESGPLHRPWDNAPFWQRPVRFADGSIPLSAILFNSLVAGVYVLVGDFASLIIFIGIVEYSMAFFSILGLVSLRWKGRNRLDGHSILSVPVPVIVVALLATFCIVSVSIVRHPVSGVGFVICCMLSSFVYKHLLPKLVYSQV